VQKALSLALADRASSSLLDEVFVDDVTPAPGSGRLLVHVVVPNRLPVADVLAALRLDAPRLRAEVAGAIHRKRAPELTFVPALAVGGDDV
jgi:ribosome-binding factor A